MIVNVVSEDVDLHRLCQGVLRELPGNSVRTFSALSIDPAVEADLYIWDFRPDVPLPQYLERNPANIIFLVHRKDLNAFRTKTEVAESNILLKPVTRATLAAILGLAVSSRTVSSLRADRDRFLQCLIQTNLKLQENDQDRTNFLARVVHDFRGPLSAQYGYCGLLLDEKLGTLNENQKEIIQCMQRSAKRLSRMASAMFQLSVGGRLKTRPDLERADIRICLDQALHELAPFAGKRIRITSDFDPCDKDLYFEPGQIEQVFLNILDNACKFTPKDGLIKIRGYPFFWERRANTSWREPAIERRRNNTQQPNSYRIDVQDSGAAIAPEHLDSIFEEYTSYSGGRNRSEGGLGLAICRMIISQHEGKLWAENTAEGPMLSFVLPMPRVTAGAKKYEKTA